MQLPSVVESAYLDTAPAPRVPGAVFEDGKGLDSVELKKTAIVIKELLE